MNVPARIGLLQRVANTTMAVTLAVMASMVFLNVVLRYGFGSGIAAAEELSRLLFVWMVFIGATAAYPQGEHMAFTTALSPLRAKPTWLKLAARLIHALVVLACALVAWGAWQQVVVGMGSKSVVLGYPVALLPLPALLCAVAIGLMAIVNFVRAKAVSFGHDAEAE